MVFVSLKKKLFYYGETFSMPLLDFKTFTICCLQYTP